MNANTNAAPVRIVTVSTFTGHTEVHGPGCADLKRKANKYDNECTWTVSSLVELSHEFWADQIGDTVDPDSPEGWQTARDWIGEFRVMPCAGKIPTEIAPAEAPAVEAAPVPASGPHAFSAKGSAKPSACVHCGRTWAASAHRAFRATA